MVLELLDNNITPLGCEFLGRVLNPIAKTNLLVVKLDHNSFGTPGLKHIAAGIATNQNVTNLSLTYCDIDSKGAEYLFEILIYTKSALEEINLSGNHLRDNGIKELFRGLSIAKSLKTVKIADN